MKPFVFLVTAMLFLVSCGNSGGDVFLGEWESGGLCASPDIMKITKQDSNYFVDIPGEGKMPATYENNLLTLKGFPVTIGYDKEGDKIVLYPQNKEWFRRTEDFIKTKEAEKTAEVTDPKEGIKGKWFLQTKSSAWKTDTFQILGLDLTISSDRVQVGFITDYEYEFSNGNKQITLKRESVHPSKQVFNIKVQRCYLYLSPEDNETATSQWVENN